MKDMQRHQILQNLFGYLSDEEVESSYEMNQQPISNTDENDGGTQFENESISKQGIKIESGDNVDEDRCSWSCDGGPKLENKTSSRHGIIKTGAEFIDEVRIPRLTEVKEDESKVRLSAVMRAVFGDSDSDFDNDEPAEYGDQDGTNHGENSISPKHKVHYEKKLKSECTVYVPEEEKAEVNFKGPSTSRLMVFEIPQFTRLAGPSQMAKTELSNIIGIDPNPFDPSTFVVEDIYVTDSSGSKRLIPPTNIIRWRNVINPDGTTSIESNARFVTWSDGSLQLFIGYKVFDIFEEDAEEIQSHVLRWNEGIYKAIGRIYKIVNVEPSSLSCNNVEKESKQSERKTTKKNARSIQKKYNKKATRKCKPKDSQEHPVSPSNVADVIDEGPKDPNQLA